MKCRYTHCRHGGNVEKEEAIKEGSSYYHKDCLSEKQTKQEIEKYYLDNLPQTTLQILRKVINQLINTNNYEANYVLYIVKKIHINKLKINNPFGLVSYCNEGRNIAEYNKTKANQEYNKIKDQINNNLDCEQVSFTYQPNTQRWTDII